MKLAWINTFGTAQAQIWPDDLDRIYEAKKHDYVKIKLYDVAESDKERPLDTLKELYPCPPESEWRGK